MIGPMFPTVLSSLSESGHLLTERKWLRSLSRSRPDLDEWSFGNGQTRRSCIASAVSAAVVVCADQRRHELAPKYPGQGLHREQEVGFARWRCPLTFFVQHPAGHDRVHMDMPLQVLAPGVQHQAEGRCAVCAAHPLWVGGKLRQGKGCAGKQRVNDPARVHCVQAVQAVRQREH